jgi:two-component sensor histidine kinase
VAAIFVSYTHVLQQKLKAQVGISEALSFEVNHRVGNHLQIIASLLALQAKRSKSDEVRQKLNAAGSQVMAIGRIQRMLSHSISRTIDSKVFIEGLVSEVREALLDSDKIMIVVQADSAALTPTMATALGALLLESINNALKHAFPVGMSGTLAIRFSTSNKEYTIELKDDGIGIENAKVHSGFGTQSLTDITHLMRGAITHHPACQSKTRPGTVWQLVIPA